MAVRPDVHARLALSPRVIVVEAPSTELTVQDLADTGRFIEEALLNIEDPPLLEASGKQDLGGGIQVGTTVRLLDTVVEFEARKSWAAQGTVTTDDLTGVKIYDSGATFTATVEPGYWVVNFTDGSVCSVIRVIDDNTILTDGLGGGVDNQWSIGDAYRILPVIQCEVSGGNVVAVDKYGATARATLATAGTQVAVARSSSATLQSQAQLEHSTFGGGVTVDVTSSYSGTAYPVGTPGQPVNNMADAVVIAQKPLNGFGTFYVRGNLTIDAGGMYDGFTFVGQSTTLTTFTISDPASVVGCTFKNATVTGVLDGMCSIEDCAVDQLTYVDGTIRHSLFLAGAKITLSSVDQATILDCWANAADEANAPEIDCGGSGSKLVVRNFAGSIQITNKTGPENAAISILNGHVFVQASVTDGEIEVSGVGHLTDNSTGTAVVESYELLSLANIEQKISAALSTVSADLDLLRKGFTNRMEEFAGTPGHLVLYDDDSITPLLTFELRDASGGGVTATVGSPAKRAKGT